MVKHLTMALVAMLIYRVLHIPLGRISVANGAGWDGIDYVAMLDKGWQAPEWTWSFEAVALTLGALIAYANGRERAALVTT